MNKIICGDALTVLRTLPDKCCRCCVTSPPYFNLRDYGVPGQIGLEPTMQAYIARLVEVFAEVKRGNEEKFIEYVIERLVDDVSENSNEIVISEPFQRIFDELLSSYEDFIDYKER